MTNVFQGIPAELKAEFFDELLKGPGVRLERIVSRGHVTPAGEWYDQDHDEWVIVLRGRARLRFEGRTELVEMGPGDHVIIPAHGRHRVEWTQPGQDTVWLAIHYG